jgi:nucleotidyltransferase-like protein
MLNVPQGLSEEQFAALSARVRSAAGHYSDDNQIQGSRVVGTARPDSDIDIAIRVSRERFDEIVQQRFGIPNVGSAKERTMQHAQVSGKLQAGEAGLRSLRMAEEAEFGLEVDISVICIGGQFDAPPYIPLK